jgi:hypothetical protein
MRGWSEQHTALKLKELCESAGISYALRMQLQSIIDRRSETAFQEGVKHCHDQYKMKA